LWLSVLAYVVLQVIVLRRASGSGRVAAALPLLVMVPVLVLTVVNLALGKNLWPIFLLLASPLALLYVVVVALLQSAPKQGSSPPAVGR
jgi:hypothetical protein